MIDPSSDICKKLDKKLPTFARHILTLIEDAGYEGWIVGGWVRDQLLDRPSADVDMASNMLPNEATRLFEEAGARVLPTGLQHGTITIVFNHHKVELTTFRSEGRYSDLRHPDHVHFVSTIAEDLARRDFRINALAFSPYRGLCDPYGGLLDIAHKRLVCVGEPHRRFSEDALRIIRLVRFARVLEFEPARATYDAALACLPKLSMVAKERLGEECMRMLSTPAFAQACALDRPFVAALLSPVVLDAADFERMRALFAQVECAMQAMQHAHDAQGTRGAQSTHDPQDSRAARGGQPVHSVQSIQEYAYSNQGSTVLDATRALDAVRPMELRLSALVYALFDKKEALRTCLRAFAFPKECIEKAEIVALSASKLAAAATALACESLGTRADERGISTTPCDVTDFLLKQLFWLGKVRGHVHAHDELSLLEAAFALMPQSKVSWYRGSLQEICARKMPWRVSDLALSYTSLARALGILPSRELSELRDKLVSAVWEGKATNTPESLIALAKRLRASERV